MLGQRFFSKGKKPLIPGIGQMVVGPAQPGMAVQPMVVQSVAEQPTYMPIQLPATPVMPMQYQQIVPQMTQSTIPLEAPQAPIGQATAFGSTLDPTKRSGMDILTHLSQRASQVLFKAATKAGQIHMPYIDTEHVLYGLLFDGQFFSFLKDLGVDPVAVQKDVESHCTPGNYEGQPQFSPRVKKALEFAYESSKQGGESFVTPEYVFIGLAQEGEGLAAQLINQHNIKLDAVRMKLLADQKQKRAAMSTGEKKPGLDDFTVDLTAKAKEGKLDPVIGRAKEIERTVHILSRRTKNNPALIGEAGTGKTAIVEGLAQRIAAGTVPKDLAHKRILSLDLTSLVAGASKRGEFEERLKLIIKQVQQSAGEIILFIDEMHNIIGTGGGEGTMDAGNILKPYLARGEIQMIGTDTLAEYHRHIEKDPALERRFQPVIVPEPSVEEAIEMIMGLRDKYETFHKVKISDAAVEAAVKLSFRYIGDRFLPDKAVDLIDEAASLKRLPAVTLPEEIKSLQTQLLKAEQEKAEAAKNNNKQLIAQAQKDLEDVKAKLDELVAKVNKQKGTQTDVVEPSDIEEIVSSWTGIPITRLTESESDKLLHLEDRIHKRLIDQEGAVKAVSEAVRRGRAGLKAAKRPIGSFLFLGPTGTGKTEMAKTLAEVLFGSEDLMIRLDMTEYMEKHEVAKLIGAPPGYVGYEEGGQLTEAVRRKPYSVVLLDEVEKAHPDVFNILIQILEDGRLTDNKGRTISFKNTILICTSNLGSNLIQGEDLKQATVQNIQSIGSNTPTAYNEKASSDAQSGNEQHRKANEAFAKLTKMLMDELRKFFRPELLNRFDEIIVFKPISRTDMLKITDIQLTNTSKLLQEQNMSMEVSDEAKKHLSEIGYDPVYGARPLRRLIQQQIETPISLLLIKQEVKDGDTVLVNFQNGEFIFSRKPRPDEMAQGQKVPESQGAQVNASGNILTTAQPGKPDQPWAAQQPVPNQPTQPPTDPSLGATGTAQTLPETLSPAKSTPMGLTQGTPLTEIAGRPATTPSAFFENQKQFLDQMVDNAPSDTVITATEPAK